MLPGPKCSITEKDGIFISLLITTEFGRDSDFRCKIYETVSGRRFGVFFVLLLLCSIMLCANGLVHYGPIVVFICLHNYITSISSICKCF